jgi:hypothetical protein
VPGTRRIGLALLHAHEPGEQRINTAPLPVGKLRIDLHAAARVALPLELPMAEIYANIRSG